MDFAVHQGEIWNHIVQAEVCFNKHNFHNTCNDNCVQLILANSGSELEIQERIGAFCIKAIEIDLFMHEKSGMVIYLFENSKFLEKKAFETAELSGKALYWVQKEDDELE